MAFEDSETIFLTTVSSANPLAVLRVSSKCC